MHTHHIDRGAHEQHSDQGPGVPERRVGDDERAHLLGAQGLPPLHGRYTSPIYTYIHVCICMYMYVCMCECVCVYPTSASWSLRFTYIYLYIPISMYTWI